MARLGASQLAGLPVFTVLVSLQWYDKLLAVAGTASSWWWWWKKNTISACYVSKNHQAGFFGEKQKWWKASRHQGPQSRAPRLFFFKEASTAPLALCGYLLIFCCIFWVIFFLPWCWSLGSKMSVPNGKGGYWVSRSSRWLCGCALPSSCCGRRTVSTSRWKEIIGI